MWHQGTIKVKVNFVIVLPNLRPHVLVKSRAGVGSSGHLLGDFTSQLLLHYLCWSLVRISINNSIIQSFLMGLEFC